MNDAILLELDPTFFGFELRWNIDEVSNDTQIQV